MLVALIGIWMILFSITMMVGLLFNFQGEVIGMLGLGIGITLLVRGNVITTCPRLCEVKEAKRSHAKYVLHHPQSDMFVDENGELTGFIANARCFATLFDAEDYAAFEPIGRTKTWNKEDVRVMCIF